eukprot:2519464-Rhodomonas_salina.1
MPPTPDTQTHNTTHASSASTSSRPVLIILILILILVLILVLILIIFIFRSNRSSRKETTAQSKTGIVGMEQGAEERRGGRVRVSESESERGSERDKG